MEKASSIKTEIFPYIARVIAVLSFFSSSAGKTGAVGSTVQGRIAGGLAGSVPVKKICSWSGIYTEKFAFIGFFELKEDRKFLNKKIPRIYSLFLYNYIRKS